MSEELKKHRHMIPLIAVSVYLIGTIFINPTISSKGLGVILIMYTLAVGYTATQTLFKHHTLKDYSDRADNLSDEAFKEGNFGRGMLYGMLIPVSAVGVIFLIPLLALFFIM